MWPWLSTIQPAESHWVIRTPLISSSQRENYWIFASLFVLSGMSGLVYQVVWARKLQVEIAFFDVQMFCFVVYLAVDDVAQINHVFQLGWRQYHPGAVKLK